MKTRPALRGVLLLLLGPGRAWAEGPPAPLVLSRAAGAITLDGDLSDPGWQGAASVGAFYETNPGDNVEPAVRTEAFLTFDERSLYVGVRCHDPEPSRIRAPFVDRDNVIGTDDNVAVFLDTRNDRRSAVELRVNPRGIQGDAVFNDANGNEDFSPDFFYDTAARITEWGWSAEYRIPFSSLRYPRAAEQTWGLLVWRNYPREFRYAFQSARIPRGSNCYICHATPITGLRDLPPAGSLVVAPYVSAQDVAVAPAPGEPLGGGDAEADVGLDVKWAPSAQVVFDAALNPDFSQVEADVPQIAVNNRFALFYPEKRPFFLEGVDLLETPVPAVYTRTITSPRWGGRGTGKLGGTAYTVLAAEDRGGGTVVLPGPTGSGFAPQDYSSLVGVARLRRDLGRSFVGLLLTSREIDGADGGGHNRVLGPDFQWRPSQSDQVTGQILFSDSQSPRRPDLAAEWDGRELTGHAAVLTWGHTREKVDWFARYRDVADGFRADDGFVPQVGYREGLAELGGSLYPTKGWLNRVRGYLDFQRLEDRDGDLVEQRAFPGVLLLGRRNLTANIEARFERLRVGERELERTQLVGMAQVDPGRRLTRLRVDLTLGDQIDFAQARVGSGAELRFAATLRPSVHLTLDPVFDASWLDVTPEGGREGRLFTARVFYLKAVYNASARAFLRLVGEYVTTDRDAALYAAAVPERSGSFAGSALLCYKLNWQTALYLGYGDDREEDLARDLRRTGRQLFVKLSYAWQR